jgi:hypothetical protein
LRTGLVKRDKSKFWDTKEGRKDEWEEIASQKRKRPNVFLVATGAAGILLLAAIVWKVAVTSSQPALSEQQPESGEPVRIQSAEEVAHAFLEQTDPHRRLDWVRNREVVATHFSLYAEETLSHVPRADRTARPPHGEWENGLARTAFAVRFDPGSFRLLNVVETPECSPSHGFVEIWILKACARPTDYIARSVAMCNFWSALVSTALFDTKRVTPQKAPSSRSTPDWALPSTACSSKSPMARWPDGPMVIRPITPTNVIHSGDCSGIFRISRRHRIISGAL